MFSEAGRGIHRDKISTIFSGYFGTYGVAKVVFMDILLQFVL
jgi:hypothetical protein